LPIGRQRGPGRYQGGRQCADFRAGGDGGQQGLSGRAICCSMYWHSMVIGAPPTDPAKYDLRHSHFACQ
jgi:hypothetical protein